MKKIIWTSLLLTMPALSAFAETAEDLDKWFRDGYAALYVKDSWDHADEFGQYFADVITTRSGNGISKGNVQSFVIDNFEGWRAEGWVGTDVAELDTTLLNDATAVFDIKWLDRNDDGSIGYECGWYIADKVDGKWLLSQYISMDCAE